MGGTKHILPIAAGALLVAAVWLAVENWRLRQELALLANYPDRLQEIEASNAQQRAQLEEHIDSLNRQLTSSAYQLSQLSNTLQETRLAADPDYEALLAQARSEAAASVSTRGGGRAGPFARFANPDTALARAHQTMPGLYDSYINTLGIPGTERQQVMNAMLDFGARRYQMLGELLAGSLSPEQASALYGADALVTNMSAALTEAQRRELRLYDRLIQQDTLREVYQEALGRSGTAITGALQERVLQTLQDHLLSEQNNGGALVAEDGSMLTAYYDRVAAFDRARESLTTELDPAQLQQLDRFIEAENNGVDVILEATSDGNGNGRVSISRARVGVEDLPQ